MLIQCTKALLDKIVVKSSDLASPEGYEELPNSFMAWHANLVTINRRKAIILMNNATRYTIMIYRPNAKDFTKIKEVIREGIVEALRMEGFKKEVIDSYFSNSGEIIFSKTGSRSMLGKLNNAVLQVELLPDEIEENKRFQKNISLITGRDIQLGGNNSGYYPYEKLSECLRMVYGKENIFDVTLYQLKISLDVEGHEIWRRVLVPSTFSFEHLHNIIQTVFDWQDAHLHEFEVDREENKTLKIIMDNYEESSFNPEYYEVLEEKFVALEDIFPIQQIVQYEYDFGESWIHTITLEQMVQSEQLQAVYLEGKGERPPEDVGGEGGFEEYLQIMSDPAHPDHENMKCWAENLRGRNLSPEKINKRLKYVLNGYQYSIYGL